MKILKKLLKITSIFIASIIVLVILTVVVAKIFEDKLAAFTMEKLENTIDAPMSVGKVSLVPLFSFPRFSAAIHELYVGDPESQNNDTLLFINSLKVGLDSWDLIRGVYTIDEMKISGLDFDYIVDSLGKSNIDFIINAFVDTTHEVKTDTTSVSLDFNAEKLQLENIKVRYNDKKTNVAAQIIIPNISIRAKAKNNIYNGKSKGSIILSHCNFETSNIHKMESCNVYFEVEYKDKLATIKELLFVSEGIKLNIEGNFGIGNTLSINTNIEANDLDFDVLRKYIPVQYDSLLGKEKLPQMNFFTIALNMNYNDNDADLKKLKFKSEGLEMGLVGRIKLGDTMAVDALVNSLKMDLGVLKKYVPNLYYDKYGVLDIGGKVDISADIVGEFADSTLIPEFDANVKLENIKFVSVDYPKIDAFNLKANLATGKVPDMSGASVRIANAEIVSNDSRFRFEGNIIGLKNTQYNLTSNMEINLHDFSKLVPDSLAQNLNGNVGATIKTSGILPTTITSDFADYALENTSISIKVKDVRAFLMDTIKVENFSTDITYAPQISGRKDVSIENLDLASSTLNLDLQSSSLSATLDGKIAFPEKMKASLKSLKIQNGQSKIIGNGQINNFGSPEFDINTNIVLKLDELMPFVPDSVLCSMSGSVVAYIRSKGRLNPDSLSTQVYPIIFENTSFNLAFDAISLAFPDSIMNLDNISARIGMRNDILTVEKFSANYNGLEIGIDSTVVKNMYSTIIRNQPEKLYINTHVSFGDLVYDDFKHLFALNEKKTKTNSTNEESSIEPELSDNSINWTYLIHGSAKVVSINIDSTAIEGMKINKLHIDDLSTLFMLTDSSYIVDQFKFKVFEGEMNNSLKYKIREDGTQSVSTHNIISNMNIHTMLRDMDNFGMDSIISYKNISGIFSTDLHTFVPIDDSVRVDKMLVSGDITLEKGGVYDYPPATEISRFTSIKELDNIQFKTLRSSIFMFKNKLYVPRTNIVSNALDIAAFGMQNLDGDCEYHMELHLSNILFGKSKRRNKKQDKTGEEVDEKSLKKSSRKIKYAVSDGKSKVGLDTKDAREDMMNKIRVQNKMLDFIFFPKNIHYNTKPE